VKVQQEVTCRYLVHSLQGAHEERDLLHHGEVVLQLLELLVEPRRAEEGFA